MKIYRLAGMSILLSGCMHEPLTGANPKSAESPDAAITVKSPDFDNETPLLLMRNGNVVKVGDRWSVALRVFGEPKPAFEFRDLPPNFQEPYHALGWENAREGLGAILYDQLIAALVHQTYRDTPARLSQLNTAYIRAFPTIRPIHIIGRHVEYTFWEIGHQRLMICGVQTHRDGFRITLALGDVTPMDALGMEPVFARKQQPKVDSLFDASPGKP